MFESLIQKTMERIVIIVLIFAMIIISVIYYMIKSHKWSEYIENTREFLYFIMEILLLR